jgi:hypothetical protein
VRGEIFITLRPARLHLLPDPDRIESLAREAIGIGRGTFTAELRSRHGSIILISEFCAEAATVSLTKSILVSIQSSSRVCDPSALRGSLAAPLPGLQAGMQRSGVRGAGCGS